MIVERVRLKNFCCYRGEHELALEPKAYSVVARLRENADRSNYLGKSTLLKSIAFALHGDHDFRTEDEFISDGEHAGEVELVLSTGDRILRSRERGRRTTLYFFPRTGPESMKDEAQGAIRGLMGMEKDDFVATCWFRQKKMSRFVDAEPSERMRIVSDWLRLGPLEECERLAKDKAAGLEAADKRWQGTLAALESREREIAKAATEGASEDWAAAMVAIDAKVPALDIAIASLEATAAACEEDIDRAAVMLAGRTKVAEFDRLVEEGKKARAEVDRVNLPLLEESWKRAEASFREKDQVASLAAREARSKGDVAKGSFDGRCPVAGIDCPAKASINEDRARSHAMAQEASASYREAYESSEKAKADERGARAALEAGRRLEARLDSLREQAKRIATAARQARDAGEPPDVGALRDRATEARARATAAKISKSTLEGWRKELGAIATTRETVAANRAANEGMLGTHREAVAIFGRRGAQRRVAEGALLRIEAGANEVLRQCGSDMRMEVRWSREGKGLATACDACGSPFPSSARAKHCERCGAERGPKLENKLEIALSAKSDGAASDLAGIGFQLAASRWLREARDVRWSSALIDEPFSALDREHRRSLAAHLVAMLSGSYGFAQALVVSHTPDTVEMLPGRIEIESDGRWAIPRVVA